MPRIGIMTVFGIRGAPNLSIHDKTVPIFSTHGFSKNADKVPGIGIIDLPLDTELNVVSTFNSTVNVHEAFGTSYLFNVDKLEQLGQSMDDIRNEMWERISGRSNRIDLRQSIASFGVRYTIGHLWKINDTNRNLRGTGTGNAYITEINSVLSKKYPKQVFDGIAFVTDSQLRSVDRNRWLETMPAGRQIPVQFSITIPKSKYIHQNPVIDLSVMSQSQMNALIVRYANNTKNPVDLRNSAKQLIESAGRNDITWLQAFEQFQRVINGTKVTESDLEKRQFQNATVLANIRTSSNVLVSSGRIPFDSVQLLEEKGYRVEIVSSESQLETVILPEKLKTLEERRAEIQQQREDNDLPPLPIPAIDIIIRDDLEFDQINDEMTAIIESNEAITQIVLKQDSEEAGVLSELKIDDATESIESFIGPQQLADLEDDISQLIDGIGLEQVRRNDFFDFILDEIINTISDELTSIADANGFTSIEQFAEIDSILDEIRDPDSSIITVAQKVGINRLLDELINEIQEKQKIEDIISTLETNITKTDNLLVQNAMQDQIDQFTNEQLPFSISTIETMTEGIILETGKLIENSLKRAESLVSQMQTDSEVFVDIFEEEVSEIEKKEDDIVNDIDNSLGQWLQDIGSAFEGFTSNVLGFVKGISMVFTDLFNGVGIDFDAVGDQSNKILQRHRDEQIKQQLNDIRSRS